jgi:glucose-6-phosphate isomerase
VPKEFAHRSVNVGDEALVFLAIYPSDSGHDYGSIERKGFNEKLKKK